MLRFIHEGNLWGLTTGRLYVMVRKNRCKSSYIMKSTTGNDYYETYTILDDSGKEDELNVKYDEIEYVILIVETLHYQYENRRAPLYN